METKKWRCTVCGQIFEGAEPPVPCPVCGAGADAFVQIGQAAPTRWKCTVCGQIFEGAQPPVPCPVCGAGADAFVALGVQTEAAARSDTDEQFVIIGGGGAALAAAKAIRERNHTAHITIVCGEGVPPYNRPALSDMVADGYSFSAIELQELSWYKQQNIKLVMDAKAQAVDAAAHTVTLTDGRVLPYAKLLLATGANAFCPVKCEAGSVPVRVLRSYVDAQALLSAVRMGSRVVVVGGGILGLEAALALREQGAQVTVVELAARLMSIQADEFASAVIETRLAALGMQIYTGVMVQKVDAEGIHLSSGELLHADLVLVSAGIRSELTLAAQLGLQTGRGIVVDGAMRTSAPDIFAAGDCAEFEGRVAGLWGAALDMGNAAGAAMCGDAAAYHAPVPATAFEGGGINLFAVGNVNGERLQTVVVHDEPTGVYHKLVLKNGKLVGVLMMGEVKNGAAAVAAVERGDGLKAALALLV